MTDIHWQYMDIILKLHEARYMMNSMHWKQHMGVEIRCVKISLYFNWILWLYVFQFLIFSF